MHLSQPTVLFLVVGGVLLSYFWWGSVFLIAVPIMVVLLVLAPLFLPEYRDPQAGRLDLVSAAMSLVGVLAVIFGIKHVAAVALDGVAIGSILVGAAVLALFIRRQLTLADPLIDLSLFRSPAFAAALGINVLGFFAAFAVFMLVAQYLQLVLGLSPLAAGLWSAPSALAFIVGSMYTPTLAARVKPATLMAAGFVVAGIGYAMLAVASGDNALFIVVAAYFVLSFGLAPVFTLATDLIIGSAPPERAGGAAGLAETSSEFGGALGIAVLGSLVTAIYRTAIDTTMPAAVPTDIAAIVRETMGGAVAAAQQLGDPAGAELLLAARDAYAAAFQTATLTCSAVVLVAAVVAAVTLRSVKPAEHDEPELCDQPECV